MRYCPCWAGKGTRQISEILKDFSAPPLARAIEANVIGQFQLVFARLPQAEIHDEPDMAWIVTDIPHPYLNCVLRAKLALDDIDAGIDATLTHFRSRGLPMTWYIGPSTEPADLGRHLTAHGLTHAEDESGMAVDLLALNEDLSAPLDLTIERVGDVETLQKWLYPVMISFNYPDFVANALFDLYARLGLGQHLRWRLYVGLLKGEPVAASRLFLGGGVGGISHLATLPEARRQGVGTAMTLAPLREARSMGYRIGVLRSTQRALGVYRRLGFKEHCKFGIYIWAGGKSQGEGTVNGA